MVAKLTGNNRTSEFVCAGARTLASKFAYRTILECGWSELFCTKVSPICSPVFIFLMCLFVIRKACDSRYCTGGVLALCAVRERSLDRSLDLLLLVGEYVTARVPKHFFSKSESYEPAVLNETFDATLWNKLRIRLIISFRQTQFHRAICFSLSAYIHLKSHIPFRNI